MTQLSDQQGIGMVEVIVALLLLSIAVLGFNVLQLSAVKATDESLMRTRSMSTMRSISESMRILPNSSPIYRQEMSTIYKSSISNNKDIVGSYCEKAKSYINAAPKCNANECDTEQMVKYNVATAIGASCEKDIVLNMEVCPNTKGTNERQCIIASWNQTKPTMNDEVGSCTKSNGVYKSGSSCFIMEAY